MPAFIDLEILALIIIDSAGNQMCGKTLLERRAYFVCQSLGQDAGYNAHFFGPFSPEIDAAVGRLKALGFIEEKAEGFGRPDRVGFEWRRYDYEVTSDGRKVLDAFQRKKPELDAAVRQYLGRMQQAGDSGDYVSLSIAAKAYFILNRESRPMKGREIRETARRFNWEIEDDQIERAVYFLEKLELVEPALS